MHSYTCCMIHIIRPCDQTRLIYQTAFIQTAQIQPDTCSDLQCLAVMHPNPPDQHPGEDIFTFKCLQKLKVEASDISEAPSFSQLNCECGSSYGLHSVCNDFSDEMMQKCMFYQLSPVGRRACETPIVPRASHAFSITDCQTVPCLTWLCSIP